MGIRVYLGLLLLSVCTTTFCATIPGKYVDLPERTKEPKYIQQWGVEEVKPAFWNNLKESKMHRAKNLILFLGDGLGISTVTAPRILSGHTEGKPGEENELAMGKFLYTALSKVILGRGRNYMTLEGTADPEYPTDPRQNGLRKDGKNLTEQWLEAHKGAWYIWNKEQLDEINTNTTKRVMGLFEPEDMKYELNRNSSSDPSIVELTEKVIWLLQKNPK